MAQGGVAGIIGDWIGGELNRSPTEGYRKVSEARYSVL
jgi:hypothetical protein